MTRFFFHNCSLTETYLDPDGMELLDLPAALAEAAAGARCIMADELRHRSLMPGRWIEIMGDDGATLATVAFHDCLYAKA